MKSAKKMLKDYLDIPMEETKSSTPAAAAAGVDLESLTTSNLATVNRSSRRHRSFFEGREQPAMQLEMVDDELTTTKQEGFTESTVVSNVITVRPMNRSERDAMFPSNASRDSSQVRPTTTDDNTNSHKKTPRRWAFCLTNPDKGTSGYQAYLTFLTLGVIYGDIGTSPLYTLTSAFPSPPDPNNPDAVIGGVSLMIYTLILTVAIKYVTFILLADDFGEGGTLALFAVISRGLKRSTKDHRTFKRWNMIFSLFAIVGVSAILADGILTPAISVMGAIDGLKFTSPLVDQNVVVGVSIAILVLFFLPQRYGTSKISGFFSPIVFVWYALLAGIGIYNISRFPRILLAFNPVYLGRFLAGQYPNVGGWTSLGSAFLTVTGSEALYADLGHFNRKAVRVSALTIVLPALVLCYLGQGAALALNPDVHRNGFYLSLPDGMFYPMLVMSVLAAIVASQALVTATFSLIAQAVRLQYFPRVNVIHTDQHEFGQVYIAEINYFLMILVLIVVIGFRDSVALGYAYGVTVSLAFLITTLLFSVAVVIHFKRSPVFAVVFFAVFGTIDANFLASNLTKFTSGGWFSVTISLAISCILCVWRFGRSRMTQVQKHMNRPLNELYQDLKPRHLSFGGVAPLKTKPLLVGFPPLMICYASASCSQDQVPAAFVHFAKRVPIKPRHLVFVTISTVSVAFVVRELSLIKLADPNTAAGRESAFQREVIDKAGNHHNDNKTDENGGVGGMYRLVVQHGYCERAPSAVEIAAFIIRELGLDPGGFPPLSDEELVRAIDPTFVVGRDRVVLAPDSTTPNSDMLLPTPSVVRTRKCSRLCAPMVRYGYKTTIEFYQILHYFSRPPAALLGLPIESTLEVGLQVPI